LDCSEKEIEGFGKILIDYYSLERLNASSNLIKRIDYVDQLKHLKFLDLSNNNIQSLGVIGNDESACPELIELDLSSNQIIVIKLLKIATIKILNISKNQIEQLTLTLPLLKELNASNNKITAVNLLDTKELENIDLS